MKNPPVVDSALRQAFADLDWVAMMQAPIRPSPTYREVHGEPGVMVEADRQLYFLAYHCRQRAEIRA